MAALAERCSNWITDWDDVIACCSAASELSDTQKALIIDQVSDLLFNLSGGQFPGVCERTIRPCIECRCRGRCCCDYEKLDLGAAFPVDEVLAVTIDGEVMDPADYRVDNWRWLVRLDGLRWPRCQDMLAGEAEQGSFSITYTWGRSIPAGARAAAISMACEFAKKCRGSASCRLPERVTSLTQQGVSMTLLDPFLFLEQGGTGLYEVDLWLTSVNRAKAYIEPGLADPTKCGPWITDTGVPSSS